MLSFDVHVASLFGMLRLLLLCTLCNLHVPTAHRPGGSHSFLPGSAVLTIVRDRKVLSSLKTVRDYPSRQETSISAVGAQDSMPDTLHRRHDSST